MNIATIITLVRKYEDESVADARGHDVRELTDIEVIERRTERLAQLTRDIEATVKPPIAVAYSKHANSCLDKCGDDEPIFVLCARDSTSTEAVQRWIDVNCERLGFGHPKIIDAVNVRDAMAVYGNQRLPE